MAWARSERVASSPGFMASSLKRSLNGENHVDLVGEVWIAQSVLTSYSPKAFWHPYHVLREPCQEVSVFPFDGIVRLRLPTDAKHILIPIPPQNTLNLTESNWESLSVMISQGTS